MKKIPTRLLSVALAFLMIFTMLPLNAFAENEYTAEAENSVAFEATNTFGQVISDIAEDETEEQQSSENFIVDVIIENNNAVVDYVTTVDANLIISLYNESGTKLQIFETIEVKAESEHAEITFEEEMPEFFLLKAFLLDENNSPLCKHFESIKYTEKFQEFLNKEPSDFEEEKVIGLDEYTESNFAVVSDDTLTIRQENEKNQLITNDFENGKYVFENADESITSLKEGDVFRFVYGEGMNDYILSKVGSVDVSDNTVTVTADDDYEISDFFSYVKLDTDTGTAQAQNGARGVGVSKIPCEVEVAINKSISEGAFSCGLVGSLKISFDIEVFYDIELFGNKYVEFNTKTTTVLSGKNEYSIEGDFEKRLPIFKNSVPIPNLPGVSAFVDLSIVFKAEGKASMQGDLSFTFFNSTRRTTTGINEKHSARPKVVWKFDATAEVEVFIGPRLTVGIEFLNFFEASAGVEVGVYVTAEVELLEIGKIEQEENPKIKHECDKCIDGEIFTELRFVAELSYGFDPDDREELLEAKISLLKNSLFEFYISLGKKGEKYEIVKYGKGTCPNIKYRVDVTVLDEDDEPIEEAVISEVTTNPVKTDGTEAPPVVEPVTTDEDGKAIAYYGIDEHSARTEHEDYIVDNERMPGLDVDFVIPEIEDEEEYEPIEITVYMETDPEGQCGDNAYYSIFDDGTLYIFGEGDMWNFEEVGYVENTPWSKKSFYIQNIVIEEKITSIGDYSFFGNYALIDIEIPDSVTKINNYAFENCDSLTGITIPNSVRSIGDYAFSDCDSIKNVTIGDGEINIGYCAFSGCGKLENLMIGDGSTNIDREAFSCCFALANVKIGNGTTNIGDYAFHNCDKLTIAIIGDGGTTVGERAFNSCDNLTTISIGVGSISIGGGAFANCKNLKSIDFLGSVEEIAMNAFSFCKSLLSIKIPYGLTEIGANAFFDCSSLSSVEIPDSVTIIGQYSFAGCMSLNSIKIPDSVERIEQGAFNTTALNAINLPLGIRYLGGNYVDEYKVIVYFPGTKEEWKPAGLPKYYVFADCSNLPYGPAYTTRSLLIDESYSYEPVLLSDEPTVNLTTKEISTIPGYNYVIVVVKSDTAEDLLSNTNLLYIDQKEAYSNTLSFNFTLDESVMEYDVVVFSDVPHTHSYETTEQAATCTTDGVKTFICSCGDTYTETISKLPHTFTEKIIDSAHLVSASTTESPAIYKYDCANCDAISDDLTFTHGDKLTVTKPAKVKSITATQTTSTITLNWSKSEGATGYRVYQYSPSKGKYVVIASIKGKTTYTKSKNLKAGSQYKFKIKPYVKLSDGTVIWGSASSAFTTATKPLAPTKVTATTTKSTITLNWSASAGATGYRVYQYSPSKGKYVVIESLKGKTSYKKSKNLKAGTTYKFKLKPYVKLADGTVIWGSASSAFAFKTKTK